MIAASGTNGAFVRHIEGPSVVARFLLSFCQVCQFPSPIAIL
jgi:hypothetical protein